MIRGLVIVLLFTVLIPSTYGKEEKGMREWTDATGQYSFKGKIVAGNDSVIILQTGTKKDLVSIEVEQLSEEDRKHIADMVAEPENPEMRLWTFRDGLKVLAAPVEFVQENVVLRRRRGSVYVNNKAFDNLPGVYRKLVPAFVGHFEGEEFDEQSFKRWSRKLGGDSKTYVCEGVLLELESGDMYAIPFFFFSEDELAILKPEWDDWLKAKQDAKEQEHYSMSMRARAMSEQRDKNEFKQIMRMSLQLQGVQAGLYDIWEVVLFPQGAGIPVRVVVAARDSRIARQQALVQYPGYVPGPTRKLSRRRGF